MHTGASASFDITYMPVLQSFGRHIMIFLRISINIYCWVSVYGRLCLAFYRIAKGTVYYCTEVPVQNACSLIVEWLLSQHRFCISHYNKTEISPTGLNLQPLP